MNLMALSVDGSRARFLARVACVAGLLGVLSNAADTKVYLEIKGVAGDVTDRAYENQIAVLSYDLTPAPGGGGSMSLIKYVDSSSPILTLLATTGEVIRRAILRVVESTDGKKDAKLTIDMREVLISSVQVTGNSTGAPLESVSMNFAKMNLRYHSEDKKGGR
jgi:type VI protein secretion system component Hcp